MSSPFPPRLPYFPTYCPSHALIPSPPLPPTSPQELEDNTQTYVDFLTQFTGKKKEDVRKDVGRTRYFTPDEAIEYGLIDKVIKSGESAIDAKDYEGMIAQQAAADRTSPCDSVSAVGRFTNTGA